MKLPVLTVLDLQIKCKHCDDKKVCPSCGGDNFYEDSRGNWDFCEYCKDGKCPECS